MPRPLGNAFAAAAALKEVLHNVTLAATKEKSTQTLNNGHDKSPKKLMNIILNVDLLIT